MENKKKIICALIIGRKGSIGFPKKNLYPLLGRPMVMYPILAAKKSKMVEDYDLRIYNKQQSQINQLINELTEIGCFYKDWNFTHGLIDFPALINNETVFLCWRSDESQILYYHKIESGYTGRISIPSKYQKTNS